MTKNADWVVHIATITVCRNVPLLQLQTAVSCYNTTNYKPLILIMIIIFIHTIIQHCTLQATNDINFYELHNTHAHMTTPFHILNQHSHMPLTNTVQLKRLLKTKNAGPKVTFIQRFCIAGTQIECVTVSTKVYCHHFLQY